MPPSFKCEVNCLTLGLHAGCYSRLSAAWARSRLCCCCGAAFFDTPELLRQLGRIHGLSLKFCSLCWSNRWPQGRGGFRPCRSARSRLDKRTGGSPEGRVSGPTQRSFGQVFRTCCLAPCPGFCFARASSNKIRGKFRNLCQDPTSPFHCHICRREHGLRPLSRYRPGRLALDLSF
jgi:hypothetical protein